jgi:hypothetical protein
MTPQKATEITNDVLPTFLFLIKSLSSYGINHMRFSFWGGTCVVFGL